MKIITKLFALSLTLVLVVFRADWRTVDVAWVGGAALFFLALLDALILADVRDWSHCGAWLRSLASPPVLPFYLLVIGLVFGGSKSSNPPIRAGESNRIYTPSGPVGAGQPSIVIPNGGGAPRKIGPVGTPLANPGPASSDKTRPLLNSGQIQPINPSPARGPLVQPGSTASPAPQSAQRK